MAGPAVAESVHIIRTMLKAGSASGADPDLALERVGLGRDVLDDPDARVPIATEEALWEVLVELTGDPCFGLHAALGLEPGEFDVMDYAIRTSETLREALYNARRYNRLLHDVAEFELVESADVAVFRHYFRDDPRGASRQASDFTLASVHAVGATITGERWRLRGVDFQHAPPRDDSPYRAAFGCTPVFGARRNALEFDAAALDTPVVGGDPALHAVLIRHADSLLSRLPAGDDVVGRVRTELTRALDSGDASIERIAARLHTTPRTLQRQLKDSGVSFNELLDAMRKGLSEHYLSEGRLGVAEIAYLLGYSEPSAFHRAFRRWFGDTPAAWRARALAT